MIQFGIDTLLQQNPSWKSDRIGFITNNAATTNQLIPSRQALINAQFNIVKLFSPEHGLDVQGADGVKMNDGIDALTQLPIISLYGEKLKPNEVDLQDIDLLLFDILEAATKYNKPLIILDRPNPLSGTLAAAEGPLLDEENCSSFIGRSSMPLKHSCTLGELALYFNQTKNIHAKLEIIACKGWERSMTANNWGVDFVPTSPAIKTFTAAALYLGLGLLEATNISEGRGTNLSFEIAGTPWMDGEKVANVFNSLGLDNINLKPIKFTPTQSKYTNQLCHGVQFIITHFPSYSSVFTSLLFIKLVKDLYPNQFAWQPYPTNVNPTGKQHLDKLLGIKKSEQLFDAPMQNFLQKMQQLTKVGEWEAMMKPYLLYV
jgi:uncharacterized protein YbbC (DUF1343 family)